MTEKKRAHRDANNVRKQQDFWRQVREASEQTNILSVAALLAFRKAKGSPPAFLRWGLSSAPKSTEKPT
jgi:hypothetical protein